MYLKLTSTFLFDNISSEISGFPSMIAKCNGDL